MVPCYVPPLEKEDIIGWFMFIRMFPTVGQSTNGGNSDRWKKLATVGIPLHQPMDCLIDRWNCDPYSWWLQRPWTDFPFHVAPHPRSDASTNIVCVAGAGIILLPFHICWCSASTNWALLVLHAVVSERCSWWNWETRPWQWVRLLRGSQVWFIVYPFQWTKYCMLPWRIFESIIFSLHILHVRLQR